MQRHATLTECAILKVADPPPQCRTVLLDKFNENDYNELCIGSENGVISIFASCDAESPRATGKVDVPIGDSIAILVSGNFLGEEKLIVAITSEGLCYLMNVGASSVSPVLGSSSFEGPINPSVGVSVARPSSAANVLVVGTTTGNLTVLDFSRHMNSQSSANMTANLDHKITSIIPLDGPGGITYLACGLDGGSIVLLDWPSLALIGKIPTITIPSTIDANSSVAIDNFVNLPSQQTSLCVDLSSFSADRGGHELCITTASGGLASVQLTVDDVADGAIKFHGNAMLDKPSLPWIGVSTIPKAPSSIEDTLNSILVACTADGKIHLVDMPTTAASPELDDGLSPHCTIDVSSLFTSPLRAFISGQFRISREDHNARENEQTCLFFCLANGEVLAFHSLARQLGSGPAVPMGCDRYIRYPGVQENLAAVGKIKAENTATPEQDTDLLTLNWASTLSQSALKDIRREISELEQHSKSWSQHD